MRASQLTTSGIAVNEPIPAVAQRRRKLAVLGAFGGANAGDEMIMRSVLDNLREDGGYAGDTVVVCGRTPDLHARAIDYVPRDARVVLWKNPIAAARAVIGRDLFIGGGQLIDGMPGIKNPLIQAGLAAIVKATGGRVVVGGVGVGKLQGKAVRIAYGQLFALADAIIARDDDAAEVMRAISPSQAARIHSEADTVFAIADSIAGPQPVPVHDRRVVAFAIHHAPHLPMTDAPMAVAAMKRILDALPEGHRLELLAHDRRAEYDLEFAQHIAAQLADPRVSVRTFADTEECIDAYRKIRTIVSLRMHPIIIGLCAGCFVLPLESSRKQKALAARLGLHNHALETMTSLELPVMRALLGYGAAGQRPSSHALAALITSARNIFATMMQKESR